MTSIAGSPVRGNYTLLAHNLEIFVVIGNGGQCLRRYSRWAVPTLRLLLVSGAHPTFSLL
ncbi:hypothetical protein [Scytonema sp. NUACC21]